MSFIKDSAMVGVGFFGLGIVGLLAGLVASWTGRDEMSRNLQQGVEMVCLVGVTLAMPLLMIRVP